MICFHRFGKWRDILVFFFAGACLLQGRKCAACGKTKFRIANPSGPIRTCSNLTEDALRKADLWDPERGPEKT